MSGKIEYFGSGKKKKRNYALPIIVFIVFAGILSLLIYTGFYGDIPFTGNVVSNLGKTDSGKGIGIKAELNVPEISLDGEFKKVSIEGRPGSFIYVGNSKLNSNRVVIENFDGDIEFNSEKISALKGEASDIFVNGVSVRHKSKSTIDVEIGKGLEYHSLEIPYDVSIKEISYKASGEATVNEDRTILNLDNDPITIEDFYGSLYSEEGMMTIEGTVSEIDVKGKSKIRIGA